MSRILAIASNTFRQTVRQRLFFNVAIFGVGMLLLSMIIGNLTFGYPDRVVRSLGLSGVSISLDLIALLVGVSLVYEEIDKKTLFVVLTRPVARWQYVVGRYLGLLFALVVTLIGLSLVFVVTLRTAGGEPILTDAIALSAALPEAAILGGVGLVLSCFSTPTLSAGIGIGIWIASATSDDLVRLTVKADAGVKLIAQTAYYVLPSLARLNFREAAIYADPIALADFAGSVAYGVVYVAVLVSLASLILTRREMV